jgi:ubiquinone/menaquinone biosynthesis C-methylase UbiE
MTDFWRKLYKKMPVPEMTRPRNFRLFEWMNRNAAGRIVLNLGSGVGRFDKFLSSRIEMVRADIDLAKPRLNVAADAESLPFKSGSFDIVYSIAVLEHVRKPWLAAEEITRILKPGGHVVLEVPFLNVIHDRNDYFRFTDKGLRSLFDEAHYEVVLEQVGSGGGSFLSVFLVLYVQQFIPTKIGKAAWYAATRYIFSVFKYIDKLIERSPELRTTANSFSLIAKKR